MADYGFPRYHRRETRAEWAMMILGLLALASWPWWLPTLLAGLGYAIMLAGPALFIWAVVGALWHRL